MPTQTNPITEGLKIIWEMININIPIQGLYNIGKSFYNILTSSSLISDVMDKSYYYSFIYKAQLEYETQRELFLKHPTKGCTCGNEVTGDHECHCMDEINNRKALLEKAYHEYIVARSFNQVSAIAEIKEEVHSTRLKISQFDATY